jgi:AcrR family transcriptional regulator
MDDEAESNDSPEARRVEPEEVPDADSLVAQGESPPSERTPLDHDRVVAVAIAFIDEYGLPPLTMRRLGGLLQVEAMALYRHVPGREAILDAVVEAVVDEMRHDQDILDAPRYGWQDYLQRLAHGVRRMALLHPRVFPLVASRPPEAPWLRPPLRSLLWVESFLVGLRSEGFSDEAAVAAYRAFTSFLLGHLLLEVAAQGADLGPLDVIDEGELEPDGLDPYPTVRRLRGSLAEDHAAAEFEESLEDLLNRIALIQSEN